METKISLTDQESTLRQLLLDVSTYIGSLEGYAKPELRFTGGWVRDKLLGSASVDIDIGINTMTGFTFGTLMKQYLAQPDTQTKYKQNILSSLSKIEANPEKSKHLETVTTRILGLDIDLVNLRKETYVENSRHPVMEFGTPEEDALRRDATVNALFYNLSTCEVEDLTGRGLEDMQRRVLKTPLAPLQTFKDDPLRVLRAIRFASRLTYEIAAEDEKAMSDGCIKDALKLKISRERVGVEVTKMLKGPNPYTALALIDRLGLYNEVFTNPTDRECTIVDTARWSKAYNQLLDLVQARSGTLNEQSSIHNVSTILLRNPDDTFLAWVVACFVPWARQPQRLPDKVISKKLPSAASLAAREGIKADNKITRVVDDAVSHLKEIVEMKNSTNDYIQPTTSPLKRKQGTTDRVSQGQSIRKWGTKWRTSVLYALLTQVRESETPGGRSLVVEKMIALLTRLDTQKTLDEYATWLSDLQSLDLLDVDQVKPMVHGNQLTKALGAKSGPWMSKALNITMEWQLRNPDETDPAGAIAEVIERKKELGID